MYKLLIFRKRATTQDSHGLLIREDPLEILAGKLPELINALANHDTADKAYIDIFLATHQSFMSSSSLLDQLIKRFKFPHQDLNIGLFFFHVLFF